MKGARGVMNLGSSTHGIEIPSLERDGSLIRVRGSHKNVADRFTVPISELVRNEFGERVVRRRRPLLVSQSGLPGRVEELEGPAGLEPLVARVLQEGGNPYVHRTERPAELPAPDVAAAAAFGAPNIEVFNAVNEQSHVLLKHGRGVDPDDLAVQITAAFPTALTTIATGNIGRARWITRRLRSRGVMAGLITSKDLPSEKTRVVVVTYEQLGRVEAHLHHLDLLVFPDALTALGKVARSRLAPPFSPVHYRVPRVIGLVPADQHLALPDRIELVELFGPVTMTIPTDGMVERQVEVVPVYCKGGKACWDPRAVNRKRRNLWRHPRRNRLIARLARSLLAGDRAALAAYVPGLENLPDFPLPARVAVVVENMEHAEALKAELRDWPVDEPAAGLVAHEIATFDWLRSRPLNDLDALVRADGGTGLPPLAPFALASPSSAPARPLVVADVLDRSHPELRKAVRSREHAYVEAGWRPAGCDAVDFVLFTLFPERARR
jgi:hypothetical protein